MKVDFDIKNKQLIITFKKIKNGKAFGDFVRAISTGAMKISGETCEDDMGRWTLNKIEKELKNKSNYAKKVLKVWWSF